MSMIELSEWELLQVSGGAGTNEPDGDNNDSDDGQANDNDDGAVGDGQN